jgi:hypothetical protein
MNVGEFMDWLGDRPAMVLGYFTILPFAALLSGVMGRGEGHLSPWKYWYSSLLYLVCIPGILAISLSTYLMIFERRSILQTDLYTQVLPIMSMILTLMLVRRNVSLENIPGFSRISGLLTTIFAVMFIKWLIDKTQIIAFAYIPIQYVLLTVVALLLFVRYGLSNLLR